MRLTSPRDFDQAIADLGSRDLVFVGAGSGEERSSACFEQLVRSQRMPRSVYVVDYDTPALRGKGEPDATTEGGDSLLWQASRRLQELRGSQTKQLLLNPYASQPFIDAVVELRQAENGCTLVLDYSCFTRVHVIALATIMAQWPDHTPSPVLCYTIPQSYVIETRERRAWRDVLLVPIGSPKASENEGRAYGLVMAGHDSDRLGVALQEYEPDRGIVTYIMTKNRPDFYRRAREANSDIVSWLRAIRDPGPDTEGEGFSWTETVLMLEDVERVESATRLLVDSARQERATVLLFPFGPKLSALAAAFTIARESDIPAWGILPTPIGVEGEFSWGVGPRYCVSIADP